MIELADASIPFHICGNKKWKTPFSVHISFSTNCFNGTMEAPDNQIPANNSPPPGAVEAQSSGGQAKVPASAAEAIVSSSPSSAASTAPAPTPSSAAAAAAATRPSPSALSAASDVAPSLPDTPTASTGNGVISTPALASPPIDTGSIEREENAAILSGTSGDEKGGTVEGSSEAEPTDTNMEIDAINDDAPDHEVVTDVEGGKNEVTKISPPPADDMTSSDSHPSTSDGEKVVEDISDPMSEAATTSTDTGAANFSTMEARPPTPPPPPRPPTPPLASPNRSVPKAAAADRTATGSADEEDEIPLQQLKKKRDEEEEQKSTTESAFAAAQAEAEALRRRVQELEEKLKNNQKEQEEAEWDGSGDVQGGGADDDEVKKRQRAASQSQATTSKRRKVTAEIKKDYVPGFVDVDEAYYCTLDDETCFEAADKLGVKWKDLALANKRRYGTIREWDRFQEYTTLAIPNNAKKENVQSLRIEPTSSDEEDAASTPKQPSMIASDDAAPAVRDDSEARSTQKLARSIENRGQHFTITAADNEKGGPFVPARLPSNDAARDPAHEMWAHRLLGKEVEVYWEEDENKDSDDENDYSDSDDEGDPTDWYEAKIVSYNPEDGMFGVEFVGDETSIYRMELSKNIVRPSGRRLEDPRTVVEDRQKYLDSLARRKSIVKYAQEFQEGAELNQALDEDTLFHGDLRLRAQSMLRKSLIRGCHFMGIDPLVDADAETFCSIKSWELEQALYAEFNQIGDKKAGRKHQKLSSEYKTKIRILKSNLEDIKNPTLAPRVLAGKLSIADLIQMTPEELASRATKMKRIKAEEEANKDIVLTPGIGTSPDKKVAGKAINTKEISGPPLVSLPKVKPASATSVHIKDLLKAKARPPVQPPQRAPVAEGQDMMGMMGMMGMGMGMGMPGGVPPHPYPASEHPGMHMGVAYQQAHAPLPPFAPAAASHLPQPNSQQYSGAPYTSAPVRAGYAKVAPVSFHAANGGQLEDEGSEFAATGHASAPAARRTGRVLNNTGGMRFLFKISSLVHCQFETSFVLECEGNQPRLAIDRYLPENIPQEAGRLSFSEFDKFVGGKLGRKSSVMALLRMVDVHDDDEANFRKFYKTYEEAGRIPIFKLEPKNPEGPKLFLVTPKFMRARCLQGKMEQANQRKAHAVILMKPGTLPELPP